MPGAGGSRWRKRRIIVARTARERVAATRGRPRMWAMDKKAKTPKKPKSAKPKGSKSAG